MWRAEKETGQKGGRSSGVKLRLRAGRLRAAGMPSAAGAHAATPHRTLDGAALGKRASPFVPIAEMRGRSRRGNALGAEAAGSAARRAGDEAPRVARLKGRLTVQGGRLWMLQVKSRHRRAEAAVRRYLAAEEGGKAGGAHAAASTRPPPTALHPGVQAQRFKAELRASLKKLRSQLQADRDDADAAQLSEASTAAAMETEAPGGASSPDSPASPLEEICENVWDAVTNKASDNMLLANDCDGDLDEAAPTSAVKPRRKGAPVRSGCVAIDCEMVGVGRCRSRSILARVAVVDEHGTCLLDNYVRPTETVTDYRTRWSGIRARDLVGAPSFDSVRQRVAQLIRGKILVGHAIHNDLKVLNIPHPPALIRDTAFFPGLRRALSAASDRYDPSHCPSLKNLCKYVLGTSIQTGEHCPVEDAVGTMKLYMRFRGDWEAGLLFSD